MSLLPLSSYCVCSLTLFRNANGAEQNWPVAPNIEPAGITAAILAKRICAEFGYALIIVVNVVEMAVLIPLHLITTVACEIKVFKRNSKISRFNDLIDYLVDHSIHAQCMAVEYLYYNTFARNLPTKYVTTREKIEEINLSIAMHERRILELEYELRKMDPQGGG